MLASGVIHCKGVSLAIGAVFLARGRKQNARGRTTLAGAIARHATRTAQPIDIETMSVRIALIVGKIDTGFSACFRQWEDSSKAESANTDIGTNFGRAVVVALSSCKRTTDSAEFCDIIGGEY